MIFDLLERYVGHRERKLGAVILVVVGGLSTFAWSASLFSWLDQGIGAFPLLTLRNLLGVLLILIAIGWWKNRL